MIPNIVTDADFYQDWSLAQFITLPNTGEVEQYVNGKNLACPMPLLKLKMALKTTAIGNHVYVTATDPNSQHDIGAFCQHAGHTLVSSITDSRCSDTTNNSDNSVDTIFHLLITKNS